MLWKERIMDQTCQDCYDAAVAAYRKSALADISNMRPINTEEAIRSAVVFQKGNPPVTNDLYAQAFAGLVPGRELDMEDRYRLIRELNQLGYSDMWIAKHTHGTLSSITAARVRLGLPERDPREAW